MADQTQTWQPPQTQTRQLPQTQTRQPPQPRSSSTSPVATTLSKSAILPRDLHPWYNSLAALESQDEVCGKVVAMMETRTAEENVMIYLAARTLFVDRMPGNAERERDFVDAIWIVHPDTGKALADVRVLAHMLLLQNDDEDNYGFALDLCRHICIRAQVSLALPMFRFKLHALRLQAATMEKPYNRIFGERDMSGPMFFVDEMIKNLEEQRVLVLNDALEMENAKEIADEVFGDIGFAALDLEPLTKRIYYDIEREREGSGSGFGSASASAPSPSIDWYRIITHSFARCATVRKRSRVADPPSS